MHTDLAPRADAKRLHGQFFTTTNPFANRLFTQWTRLIADFEREMLLEPFAGAGNIVQMLRALGYTNEWACFDIDPPEAPEAEAPCVRQRDTLAAFPTGYRVAITNPPYLAKNSARRRNLPFPDTAHDDLYKLALATMLTHCEYVAAIVPESLLTAGLFHERLYGVVSLTCRMFEDTDVPVGLALFAPPAQARGANFWLYRENTRLGTWAELRRHLQCFEGEGLRWQFNAPHGDIALFAVDSTREASIRFAPGDALASERVSAASRSNTRIACPEKRLSRADVAALIEHANRILAERRSRTHDAFMTPFMGLREDGRYRRRLDYEQAREILNLAARGAGLLPVG